MGPVRALGLPTPSPSPRPPAAARSNLCSNGTTLAASVERRHAFAELPPDRVGYVPNRPSGLHFRRVIDSLPAATATLRASGWSYWVDRISHGATRSVRGTRRFQEPGSIGGEKPAVACTAAEGERRGEVGLRRTHLRIGPGFVRAGPRGWEMRRPRAVGARGRRHHPSSSRRRRSTVRDVERQRQRTSRAVHPIRPTSGTSNAGRESGPRARKIAQRNRIAPSGCRRMAAPSHLPNTQSRARTHLPSPDPAASRPLTCPGRPAVAASARGRASHASGH